MRRDMLISLICLLVALAAFGVSIATFMRVPEERVELVSPPAKVEEFRGPIYTGTGTGYIIEFENGVKFYFAGDTGLFGDMKFVIGDYYRPDAAFLPIGDVYTMNPQQAAVAASWINPKYVIPYHYHTFPELAQTVDEFAERVRDYRAAGETRAEVVVLKPGEKKEIEGIGVTWLGHATMLLESVEGSKILIDPWLEANPDCPPNYKNVTAFGGVDLVLLTHGHVDHVTYEELDAIAKLYQPVIIAQWELGIYLQDHVSVPIALMNIGGTMTKEKLSVQGFIPPEIINSKKLDGIKVTMVQALHSSSPP